MKQIQHQIGIILITLTLTSSVAMAEKIERSELGRSVKLMILVDKVMQPQADWTTEEWMIKATADAGFNVFSPRSGYDRLDEVLEVTEWCEKYGIYHMPWMRGSLTSPKGPEADGKRLVWADGAEQPLWSPNADEFWNWTAKYILEYARISARNPYLMGVFLDYENYVKGGKGNLYSLSYDELILKKFAKDKEIEIPELPPAERKTWLDDKGLHQAFEDFQIAEWRQRCGALRKAVDAIAPEFQFCIYPAPGTPFMTEAIYPEWSTPRAPLILADAATYGRSSRFTTEKEALSENRATLLKNMEIPKKAGIPYIYSGGIDPVVDGADPEFSGKNAVMISEITDGYWIFYEGPNYTKDDHKAYWKWFTWANAAIAKGNYKVQSEPRQTPEDWDLDIFDHVPKELIPPQGNGVKIDYPRVQLRRENLILVSATKGQEIEIGLRNHEFDEYRSSLIWQLQDSSGVNVAKGRIPNDGSGVAKFKPESNGIYYLGISSGRCSYSITHSNVPLALDAGDHLGLFYGAERLYFDVPKGVSQFIVHVEGAQGIGPETVRVNIYDAKGEPVISRQTTPTQEKIEIKVQCGNRPPGVWSIETTKADEGTLEDNSIKIEGLPAPALSFTPQQVFRGK